MSAEVVTGVQSHAGHAGGKPMTAAEGRKFGLVVGGAFLALTAVLWWRGRETTMLVTGALGVLLFVGGLIVPRHLGPVQRAWMQLALLISKVTTPIFMGVVFFLVITPAGVLARAFGHKPLLRKPVASAWVARPEPASRRSNLERQF